jgi:hypothetical protein
MSEKKGAKAGETGVWVQCSTFNGERNIKTKALHPAMNVNELEQRERCLGLVVCISGSFAASPCEKKNKLQHPRLICSDVVPSLITVSDEGQKDERTSLASRDYELCCICNIRLHI